MHLVITISTYNRCEPCLNLIKQIYEMTSQNHVDLFVFDDASSEDYSEVKKLLESNKGTYHRSEINHGKKLHWMVSSTLIQYARKKISKKGYYFYLQDDLILKDNFFTRCIELFESIDDTRKVVLNPCLDSRTGTIWTQIIPKSVKFGSNEFIKVGWVDLRFMASARFFFAISSIFPINPNRWDSDQNLSSGVGKQISQRLAKYNAGIYQTKFSLYDHGTIESVMNPEARKINKLKSI